MQFSKLLIDEIKKLDSKVLILIPKSENFGVRFYCEAFKSFLITSGVEADIQRVSIVEYIKKYRYYKNYTKILNLDFLLLSFIFPNSSIAILHGFPNRSDYTFFKYNVVKWVIYLSTRCCVFTIANSSLTKDINEKFHKISSDFIWNPLIEDTQDFVLDTECGKQNLHNKPSLVFAGRISKAKGFNIIIDYIKSNTEQYSSINIIGPDPNNMTKQLLDVENVNIYGAMTHDDVLVKLAQHDIFVSLNFLEPFGMVYLEALGAECIVVSPYHSGFNEHANSSRVVAIQDTSSLGIKNALSKAVRLYYDS